MALSVNVCYQEYDASLPEWRKCNVLFQVFRIHYLSIYSIYKHKCTESRILEHTHQCKNIIKQTVQYTSIITVCLCITET